jgi:hypothetical protein
MKETKKRKEPKPLQPGQKAGPPEVMAVTYNCSAGHLANLRSRKEGPKFYKRDHRIYYKVSDFEEWLFSNPIMTADAHNLK